MCDRPVCLELAADDRSAPRRCRCLVDETEKEGVREKKRGREMKEIREEREKRQTARKTDA